MVVSIDYDAWVNSTYENTMQDFTLCQPRGVRFYLSDSQYQVLEDMLERYGDTAYGRAQIMRRINPNLLWRNFEYVEDASHLDPKGKIDDGFIGDSHADDFRASQFE